MMCEVCGVAERTARLIRYSLDTGERVVVVEHVPAEVCPHCGETTLLPDVVERLQATVAGRTPVKYVETPVYEFA